MRKSRAVSLSITAAMALALSGCGSEEPPADAYQAVCTDPNTQMRVDDDQCGDDDRGHNGFLWYYFPMGSTYSGHGSKVSGGTYAKPSNFVLGGAPRTAGKVTSATVTKATTSGGKTFVGGSVSRGGFGGSAKGGSSGG
jgi:hypothetical protein